MQRNNGCIFEFMGAGGGPVFLFAILSVCLFILHMSPKGSIGRGKRTRKMQHLRTKVHFVFSLRGKCDGYRSNSFSQRFTRDPLHFYRASQDLQLTHFPQNTKKYSSTIMSMLSNKISSLLRVCLLIHCSKSRTIVRPIFFK